MYQRTTQIRRAKATFKLCDNCGHNKTGSMQQYGQQNDAGYKSWELKIFCSKACHDEYWRNK